MPDLQHPVGKVKPVEVAEQNRDGWGSSVRRPLPYFGRDVLHDRAQLGEYEVSIGNDGSSADGMRNALYSAGASTGARA